MQIRSEQPVTIGTIDVLPIGIFAYVTAPDSEPLAEAFERLFTDSAVQAELCDDLRQRPLGDLP